MSTKSSKSKGQRVQSVERSLDILEYVVGCEGGSSLADLANLLGVSPAAAFNLSETLTVRGYLERAERPVRYRIGPKLSELAQAVGDHPLLERIGEVLRDFSVEWPGVNLLVVTPEGGDLMIRLRMDPTRAGVVQRPFRSVLNPYSLATALCLLAFLPSDRLIFILQRYPLEEFAPRDLASRAELDRNLASIREAGGFSEMLDRPRAAFPILGRDGQVVAAIGSSITDDSPVGLETFRKLEAELRFAAERLSMDEATPSFPRSRAQDEKRCSDAQSSVQTKPKSNCSKNLQKQRKIKQSTL